MIDIMAYYADLASLESAVDISMVPTFSEFYELAIFHGPGSACLRDTEHGPIETRP